MRFGPFFKITRKHKKLRQLFLEVKKKPLPMARIVKLLRRDAYCPITPGLKVSD